MGRAPPSPFQFLVLRTSAQSRLGSEKFLLRYLRPIGLRKFFWLNRIVETLSSNLIQDCAAGNKSAERELGAFLAAVTELFGADRARHAAEDWLDELELQETFSGDIDWRPITVAAAIRLAQRMHGAADVDTRVSPRPSSNCSGPKARAELF